MIDAAFWKKRRVFLTGHTGFKGGWTAFLLHLMGAEVFGYALAQEHTHGIFAAADVLLDVHHTLGDVSDMRSLQAALVNATPEIVIHMAAQSLVRHSYAEPVSTYATNVMGTVHVLEAARQCPSVRSIVIVTSDKCYENSGTTRSYRENDRLGGDDPYSSSKACAELVTSAYRRSFFSPAREVQIASARAGNVIGGGDWATDRLIPDAMRAFKNGQPLRIRNPQAVRPWQHVLDPVMGYLNLAQTMMLDGSVTGESWNFGPAAMSEMPVSTVADRLVQLWGNGASWQHQPGQHPHEAAQLRLDSGKATGRLNWRPALDLDDALAMTVAWYRALHEGKDMRKVTRDQIEAVLTLNAKAVEPARV